MRVADLVDQLGLTVFAGSSGLDNVVEGGYTSDLLSDVMGSADANHIWITLQTHKNVMAIASLKDLAAVVIVKGNKPDTDTIEQSNTEGIPLLGTSMEAFEVSGRVFGLITRDK